MELGDGAVIAPQRQVAAGGGVDDAPAAAAGDDAVGEVGGGKRVRDDDLGLLAGRREGGAEHPEFPAVRRETRVVRPRCLRPRNRRGSGTR